MSPGKFRFIEDSLDQALYHGNWLPLAIVAGVVLVVAGVFFYKLNQDSPKDW